MNCLYGRRCSGAHVHHLSSLATQDQQHCRTCRGATVPSIPIMTVARSGRCRPDHQTRPFTRAMRRLLQSLKRGGATAAAKQALDQRTRTVERLLEFSQTVQGAGKADQVFGALAHFLRIELDLAGVLVLTHESDSMPTVTVKAQWPESLASGAHPIGEMDTTLCPCLRQSLPREFKADGCPVR